MGDLNPVRLSMSWRTENNSCDCGVFCMRHMETYFGEEVFEWQCGLDDEGVILQNFMLNSNFNQFVETVHIDDDTLLQPNYATACHFIAANTNEAIGTTKGTISISHTPI